jgi:hypothetical protein
VYCHNIDSVDKVLGDLVLCQGAWGGVVSAHDVVGGDGGALASRGWGGACKRGSAQV